MNKFFLYFKSNLYYFCFFFLFIIFLKTFHSCYLSPIGDGWAYRELFINYSGGFTRRGLFGELFLIFNKFYYIEPYKFFFIILYYL